MMGWDSCPYKKRHQRLLPSSEGSHIKAEKRAFNEELNTLHLDLGLSSLLNGEK